MNEWLINRRSILEDPRGTALGSRYFQVHDRRKRREKSAGLSTSNKQVRKTQTVGNEKLANVFENGCEMIRSVLRK